MSAPRLHAAHLEGSGGWDRDALPMSCSAQAVLHSLCSYVPHGRRRGRKTGRSGRTGLGPMLAESQGGFRSFYETGGVCEGDGVWRRRVGSLAPGGKRGRRVPSARSSGLIAVRAAPERSGSGPGGETRNVEIKKLGEQQLNNLMKRWLAAPAGDRDEFPARRGSAPRTVMRGLAGHLFIVPDNGTNQRRPA